MGEAPATVAEPVEAGASLAVNSSRGSRQTSSDIPAAPSRAALAALTPSAVTDAQFSALSGRVGALEGRVDTLFDLVSHNRREARRGIAAAVAMTQAPMPSAAGRTSYAANSAVYRGEFGFSASIAHRLGDENPFALTAGVSHAGGKNTAARVGIAGEF
jgi:autotransporter adhesin